MKRLAIVVAVVVVAVVAVVLAYRWSSGGPGAYGEADGSAGGRGARGRRRRGQGGAGDARPRYPFAVAGTVAEVLVAEGRTVEAGQVIARLASTSRRRQLTQAEASLQRAQARLTEIKAPARAAGHRGGEGRCRDRSGQARPDQRIQSRPEEIEQAKAAVDSAQARFEQVSSGPEGCRRQGGVPGVEAAQGRALSARKPIRPSCSPGRPPRTSAPPSSRLTRRRTRSGALRPSATACVEPACIRQVPVRLRELAGSESPRQP